MHDDDPTDRPNLTALPRGHGRGPGQPQGSQLPADRCPVPFCDEQIDRTRLICRRDWYLIPRRLRGRVWRSWCSGREAVSREHQEAVLNAIAVARIARLPNRLFLDKID
jgi:hypothetical protein